MYYAKIDIKAMIKKLRKNNKIKFFIKEKAPSGLLGIDAKRPQ
jgi:hypothetical protein